MVNKILKFILILFVVTAVILGGVYFYKKKNSGNNQTGLPGCQQSALNNKSAIKAFKESGGAYAVHFVIKDYYCRYNETKDKKIYQEAVNYIKNEMPSNVTPDIKIDYFNDKNFFYLLQTEPYSNICPDKLPEICKYNLKQTYYNNTIPSEEWCNNICSLITKYESDKAKYAEEVLNITNWDVPSKNYWKLIMAWRFGFDDAKKILDSVSDQKLKDFYLQKARTNFILQISCDNLQKEAAKFYCLEDKFNNYFSF